MRLLPAGLLQTSDSIALKDITRQLQLENAVGDKVFVSGSVFTLVRQTRIKKPESCFLFREVLLKI